ncbi:hypothetical protein AHAT_21650 [Agarivorans sp. Toyoura001]|uniref:hypothetical protein n=1 Tax=Agarivorans sp. Toyoura001 TaxID=2283141 RepID=UPI0010F3106C|nr:hypothetical protein [Agarivorans sp. Toyoura001]GDY26275.1 hypothetical protein AHAT_21650 [Agarivorans sp. Toyoura001]
MLDKAICKRDAISIATMLEAGLIDYKHYMCWVDERMLLEEEPDLWVIELAATKDTQAAIGHLNSYAYSEPFEQFNSESCNDEFVASQWLRYKRKEISWAIFLQKSGDYTDGNYAREDCDYFYYMLNDFEINDFSEQLEIKQSSTVNKLFNDVIQTTASKYNEFLPYLDKYRESYEA